MFLPPGLTLNGEPRYARVPSFFSRSSRSRSSDYTTAASTRRSSTDSERSYFVTTRFPGFLSRRNSANSNRRFDYSPHPEPARTPRRRVWLDSDLERNASPRGGRERREPSSPRYVGRPYTPVRAPMAPPPAPRRRSFGEFLRGKNAPAPRPNQYGQLYPFGAARRHAYGEKARASPAVFPGYQFEKQLHHGGMSDAINLVRRHSKLYIEKRIDTSDPYHKFRAETEIKVLIRITRRGNQNLNTFVTHMWGPRDGYVSLILEYCDGGNLGDVIDAHRRANKRMTEAFLWHVLLGISNGLAFLHSGIEDATRDQQPVHDWNPVSHLDLKPHNIFLSTTGALSRELPRVVVGDFGCAVTGNQIIAGDEDPRRLPGGTTGWVAPEVEAKTRYGVASDNWQAGAIVHACARVLHEPDRSLLNVYRSCGSRYSEHLNYTVGMATLEDYRERYSATKIVREAMKAMDSMGMRYR